MNFIKQIERIKKIHKLISSEKTGTPCSFAIQLRLSRRQLYNELETLKSLDAPIKYSKKRESFYYETPFDLELKYSLEIISKGEVKKIYGGSYFRASLLHGSMFYLYEEVSSADGF